MVQGLSIPCQHAINTDMISAGEIRALRAGLGETQEQFAKQFKLDRFYIVAWEKFGMATDAEINRIIAEIKREITN